MTLYAETSAVLRWLFAESDGDQVRTLLATADKIVASRLTLVETRRVVHRAERDGRLTAVQSADIVSIFARATSTWDILQMSDDVARRAEEGFPAEPVRTLDAIHLASALMLRQAFPDLRMLTTDDRVRRNAALLGLQVTP